MRPVALAAVHRFSFVLGLLAVVGSLAFGLVRRPGAIARFAGWTIVAAVVQGRRSRSTSSGATPRSGGRRGTRRSSRRKVDWELVARDLTWPVVIAGLVALVAVLVVPPFLSDTSRFVLAGLAVSILALTYAWIAHVPTGYNRAAYFVPLLLAPTLGLLASKVPPIVAIAAAAALVGVRPPRRATSPGTTAASTVTSTQRASAVSATSASGPAATTRSSPTSAGVLSTWLLQRPVLAALDPALTLPKREVAPRRRRDASSLDRTARASPGVPASATPSSTRMHVPDGQAVSAPAERQARLCQHAPLRLRPRPAACGSG